MSHRRKDPDRPPKWCPNPACNRRADREGDCGRDVGRVVTLPTPRRTSTRARPARYDRR